MLPVRTMLRLDALPVSASALTFRFSAIFHSSPQLVEPGRVPSGTVSSVSQFYLETSTHLGRWQCIGHLGSPVLSQVTSLVRGFRIGFSS